RANAPMPKRQRLRVRIVDAKNANPFACPEAKNVAQLAPQFLPRLALEVKRINVLILLRRIFRVLNRSVGTTLEPLRMLANERMIGRSLKGDVERDFDPVLRRERDELLEIVDCAEIGVNRFVSALAAAD